VGVDDDVGVVVPCPVVGVVAPWFEPDVALAPLPLEDPGVLEDKAPPYDGGTHVGGGSGVATHGVVVTAPSTVSTTLAQPLLAPLPVQDQVAGQSVSLLQLIVSATQLDVPVGVVVHTKVGGPPSADTLPSQTPPMSGVHVK
jgi:hypothetical protein